MSIKFVDDKSAKAGNYGKIGLRQHKAKMPDSIPSSDFPKMFRIKGAKTKRVRFGGVMSRDKMDRVQFKEENIDMAGFGSSKADDQEFRGQRHMVYNPFSNSAGYVAQVGGFNEGGDKTLPKKKEKNAIIPARFRIGKKNRKSHLPMSIPEPDPFEEQLKTTDMAKPVRSGVFIRS